MGNNKAMGKERREHSHKVALGLRVVLVSSLVLFLLATVAEIYRSPGNPAANPTPTEKSILDALIVPGSRIGPVTLGLSMEQVTQDLGSGQKRPMPEGTMHLYEELGLVVYAQEGRVTSVTTRSPHFATRQGVAVGSDVDAVLSHLGRDYELEGNEKEKYVLHNWGQGWHVGVENDLVTYFQVTTPVKP